jgi:hypothetical protein
MRIQVARASRISSYLETVMEAALEETLRNPELVIRSRSDPTATLCYRYYLRTLVGGKWLCVVEAFVLTAYLTDKPKKGEVLWRKP